MANILEKGIILILGEVGPDPNILLPHDTDHVVDRRDVILDGELFPLARKGGNIVTPTNHESRRNPRVSQRGSGIRPSVPVRGTAPFDFSFQIRGRIGPTLRKRGECPPF